MASKLPTKIKKEIVKRDVGPGMQWLRDLALGRKTETGIRFASDISPRTQPQPNLPGGPAHKLSGNGYYLRDPRRRVDPPKLICGGEKLLPSSVNNTAETSEISFTSGNIIGVRPGKFYNPEVESTMPIRDPQKLAALKNNKMK